MVKAVAVFAFLQFIVSADAADPNSSGEKVVIVLCLLPILFCLYAFIVQYQTQKQLRKIKDMCLSLSRNTESMANAAAKASLGPITKKVLLEYAKTQRKMAKLMHDP